MTLTIQPGERVALIGRIGCGKSTLLKLILRLHAPRAGAVLLDGYDIRQYDPSAIRRTIGLMTQTHALFNDTLQANLLFGLSGVTAEAFERAVTISRVKDLAARQPDGYAMHVGLRGEKLSGGERQLVALARTLMGDPQVLVLDEPTASMDNALEARIINDLRANLAGRTLIVATHRAAVLDLVDRVIWIDNGRIIADGPKNEVLNRLKRTAA
jgi:ATP-binding cassette subfamily C protein LapB